MGGILALTDCWVPSDKPPSLEPLVEWGRPCFLHQYLALWCLSWRVLGVLGLLQEGVPLPGPKSGLLCNTRK